METSSRDDFAKPGSDDIVALSLVSDSLSVMNRTGTAPQLIFAHLCSQESRDIGLMASSPGVEQLQQHDGTASAAKPDHYDHHLHAEHLRFGEIDLKR
jgi:hypothetical protein